MPQSTTSFAQTEQYAGSQLRINFYYAAEGEPKRMLGMALDITERKRERELRDREDRYRSLVPGGSYPRCNLCRK